MTRVLIACEFSGTVRRAFRALGHDAWSCDLLPAEDGSPFHYQRDVIETIESRDWWDFIGLHVPCTAMGVCGNRTYGRGKAKHAERLAAVEWSLRVWDAAVARSNRVYLENPASVIFPVLKAERGALVRYVQPYMFGHPEQKKTGLALHGLMPLRSTKNVYAEMMLLPRKDRERIFFMSPSADRGHLRSIFYTGIAEAMADQWAGIAQEVAA